jgi:hypothetical protein
VDIDTGAIDRAHVGPVNSASPQKARRAAARLRSILDAPVTTHNEDPKTIYWHRELPPFDAEPLGEHTIEATSGRVPGTISHRDELWDRCYEELMANTTTRLTQEIARLGGDYGHVLDEHIDSRHNEVTGEAWLHGRFTYMLYRRPSARPIE